MKYKFNPDYFPILYGFFYLIFNYFHLSENLSLSHDSIYYLIDITDNPYILHPHHLLFFPVSSFLSKTLIFIGINSVKDSIALQSAAAGSIVLVILYYILRHNFSFTKYSSRLAVVLVSVIYGFWFYCLSIETYHLPLIFIFLSLYFITKKEIDSQSVILSAIFGGIAVLFHQLHGLFGLVVVLYLTINGFKKNFRPILIFSVVFNIVWITGYIVAFIHLDLYSLDRITRWFFKYNYEVNSWASMNSSFIFKPFVGIIRSFVTIHPLFISTEMSSIVTGIFANKEFSDDAYLIRGFSGIHFYIYAILSLITAISVISLLMIKRKVIRSEIFTNLHFRIILVFLVVYSIFFSFWDSSNLEFWIPQSILICIIASFAAGSIRNQIYKLLIPAIWVTSLFYINYQYTISLVDDKNNSYFYVEVSDATNVLPDSSVIIYDKEWIAKPSYQIYSDFRFICIKETDKNLSNINLHKSIDSIISENKIAAVKSRLIKPDFDLSKYFYTIDTFGRNSFHIFSKRKMNKTKY